MIGIKTGGRIAGTPNKTTKELREKLKVVIEAELEVIEETLKTMQPEKRIEVLIKLMPYCLPKVQSLDSNYDAFGGEWGF